MEISGSTLIEANKQSAADRERERELARTLMMRGGGGGDRQKGTWNRQILI